MSTESPDASQEAGTAGTSGASGPRFKRPERPAPSPADAQPMPEVPLRPTAGSPTGASGPTGTEDADGRAHRNGGAGGGGDPGTAMRPAGREGPQSLVEPLAALAAAFAANAEALRRSQELQAELSRALQRADRSEVMLQSTGALNDTFKNLSTIQRGLLGKIEESQEKELRGRWFLPALVLMALVVVGAVVWLLVRRLNDVESNVALTGDVATQLQSAAKEARVDARTDAEKGFATERKALEDEIARFKDEREGLLAKLKSAEGERDQERSARQSAEADVLSMRAEIQAARTEALKSKALEGEALSLKAELAVKDPEIERLRRELADEKQKTADLRARVADAGLGREPAPDGAEPAPDAPPAPSGDRTLTRDRKTIDRVLDSLNSLLQSGGAGRTDYYQVMSTGAMAQTRLVDVVAMHYGPGAKLLNSIKAKELHVTADRTRRVVEFTFTEGALDFGGKAVPFPNGAFSAIVAEGDLAPWTGSGLTLVVAK